MKECKSCGCKKLVVIGEIVKDGFRKHYWCPRCDRDYVETDEEFVKRTGRK